MRLQTLKQVGMASLLLAAMATATSIKAQESDKESGKYGFVNIGQVITQSDEGKAEAKDLESFGAEKEKQLKEKQKELEAMTREYEESASGGQPNEELRDKIEKFQRELERDARQAQSDVDVSRQDRIQAIGAKAVEIVRKFATDNGYTVIFRIDGGQVVYVDPDADITQQIIEAYNKAHPVQ